MNRIKITTIVSSVFVLSFIALAPKSSEAYYRDYTYSYAGDNSSYYGYNVQYNVIGPSYRDNQNYYSDDYYGRNEVYSTYRTTRSNYHRSYRNYSDNYYGRNISF